MNHSTFAMHHESFGIVFNKGNKRIVQVSTRNALQRETGFISWRDTMATQQQNVWSKLMLHAFVVVGSWNQRFTVGRSTGVRVAGAVLL